MLNTLFHQPLLPEYSSLTQFTIPLSSNGASQTVNDTTGTEPEDMDGEPASKRAKTEPASVDKEAINSLLKETGFDDNYSDEDEGSEEDSDEGNEDDYYDTSGNAHTSGPLDKETGQRPAFPIPKLSSSRLLESSNGTSKHHSQDDMGCSVDVLNIWLESGMRLNKDHCLLLCPNMRTLLKYYQLLRSPLIWLEESSNLTNLLRVEQKQSKLKIL